MFKKKSLGQNFLKSPKIVSDIVSAGKVTKNDTVLEIGPGEGVMTSELLAKAKKVIVIEKDHRLIPILIEKFKNEIVKNKLEVIEVDILEFDLKKSALSKIPFKLIANIPYYITGQIIRKFLEAENKPVSMTLLVQKEVAERIVARDKKESLLSLSVKVFGDPKIIRTVGRGAFSPAPNVDSAIINIENISERNLGGLDPSKFFDVLHSGFAHKRKQLLPNLSNDFPKEKVINAFNKMGLDLKIRAEDLPVKIWVNLSKYLTV
ncbi:MAG: 16S rRNA (adenine1518-N6/adenine1519-N6)-dimethyltransferase [Parcubacteria bacterium C7867-003]|nr:MAG: 16S rRNA (adenine1518-N6/adenine1519-N6)-dimethyltransferase [Parcubacteria bacterium C7867-003]